MVPFYSYKFWNMGIQENEKWFFAWDFKVVLGQFFWNLEFVPDDSISHYWYFAKLLGSWILFEILHASFTVKTSKNVVKSGCF